MNLEQVLNRLAVKCWNPDVRLFRMQLQLHLGPVLLAGEALSKMPDERYFIKCSDDWDAAVARLVGPE